jgi:hypothetical protein
MCPAESEDLMQAFRAAATVGTEGGLTLPEVPFRPGSRVEVIVLEETSQEAARDRHQERLRKLRAARGLWKDRSDLPDFVALRREWDR